MYRGSTPEIKIILPEAVPLDQMKEIWFTVKNFNVKITKKLSDGDVMNYPDDHFVKMGLTQEETLSLSRGDVKIQLRFLEESGQSYSTNTMLTTVDDILEDGVIS